MNQTVLEYIAIYLGIIAICAVIIVILEWTRRKSDYVNSLSEEDYNELLADHLGLNRSSKPMAEIKDYEA